MSDVKLNLEQIKNIDPELHNRILGMCMLANLPQTGIAVEPLFVGLTPGFVGLYQVNVVVPGGLAAGNAVPVALGTNDVQSNRVNIAVQ